MSEPLRRESYLAEKLDIPESTVADLRKRHGWAHTALGRAIRYTDEQIAQIIRNHTVTETPADAPVFPGQRKSRGRRA